MSARREKSKPQKPQLSKQLEVVHDEETKTLVKGQVIWECI